MWKKINNMAFVNTFAVILEDTLYQSQLQIEQEKYIRFLNRWIKAFCRKYLINVLHNLYRKIPIHM